MPFPTSIPFSDIRAITIRLRPGDDLKQSLDAFVRQNDITAGCIVTCIGSLQQVALRYADLSTVTITSGKFEIISLSGTIAAAGSHLHMLISDSTGQTLGGHLKEGSLIYTTAEIVLGVFPALVYTRKEDTTYGFKELSVERREEKTGD